MNAKLSADKKTLTIEIEVNPTPIASSTGKTLSVASSGGNIPMASVVIGGHPVKIGVNAFIPNPAYVAPAK